MESDERMCIWKFDEGRDVLVVYVCEPTVFADVIQQTSQKTGCTLVSPQWGYNLLGQKSPETVISRDISVGVFLDFSLLLCDVSTNFVKIGRNLVTDFN